MRKLVLGMLADRRLRALICLAYLQPESPQRPLITTHQMMKKMDRYQVISAMALVLVLQGCSHPGLQQQTLRQGVPAIGASPRLLAVYEPWFGHPQHISVGYSSHDPAVIRKQIDQAKVLGISGFVVDWYGDREPFNDQTYSLMQTIASEKNFHVAMMYDETDFESAQATDDALMAFNKFHENYLSPNSPGVQAYLTYEDRPVIFIFPKGAHTDWKRVREATDKWNPAPLLITKTIRPRMRPILTASTHGSTPVKRAGLRTAAIGEKITCASSIAKCGRRILTRLQ